MPYHLAQLNIALLREPLESERLRDFREALDEVNALADGSPGFVWRLTDDTGNATSIRPWGDDHIVNLSVWEDDEALRAFAYNGRHREILLRRRDWFAPITPYQVCWWVSVGHEPTLDEARERLDLMGQHGPTDRAFLPTRPFAPPPDEA